MTTKYGLLTKYDKPVWFHNETPNNLYNILYLVLTIHK